MIRKIATILFFGFLFYAVGMMVIRLRITQLAYEYEELKKYERNAHEEQLRLRATLAKRLSPVHKNFKDFREPEPNQIVMIP